VTVPDPPTGVREGLCSCDGSGESSLGPTEKAPALDMVSAPVDPCERVVGRVGI